jgi:hypothetical protein
VISKVLHKKIVFNNEMENACSIASVGLEKKINIYNGKK